MLFIRTTLLLGLGVLILPTDRESQETVYTGAKTAVHWTVTFCERNPDRCVEGRQAWSVFVKKAEFGFKMAIDLLNERDQPKTLTNAGPSSPDTAAAANLHTTPAAPFKRSSETMQAQPLEAAARLRTARVGN